jgi:hypothetical protein
LYKFECKAGMPVKLIADEKVACREEPACMVTYA